MTFQNSAYLVAGTLLALVGWMAWWRHYRRRRALADFLGGPLAARRLSRSDLYRFRIERIGLLTSATIAVGAAAATPRWRNPPPPQIPSVVLAIDVSASMQGSDVPPTRLAKAVEVAGHVLDELMEGQVGLVLFSGSAYPLAPPSTEHDVIRHYLNGVTPTVASAHDPGTRFSAALSASAALWPGPSAGERRSILLVGDGDVGEPQDSVISAVLALAGTGVRLYTVGVGTPEGSGMLMPEAPYQLGGPVVDATGTAAISRLDAPLLERLAVASGGTYAHADDADGVADLISALRPPASAGHWWSRYDPVELVLVLALLFLLGESALNIPTQVRRPGRARQTAA